MRAPIASDAEYRHDMRMVEPGRSLSFVLKTSQLLVIQHGGEWEELQGHAATERQIVGFIDDSHSAAPNFTAKAKVTDTAIRLASCAMLLGVTPAPDPGGIHGRLQDEQAVQLFAERRGDLGVPCQPFLDGRRSSGL
jgi:hypothetical protein